MNDFIASVLVFCLTVASADALTSKRNKKEIEKLLAKPAK